MNACKFEVIIKSNACIYKDGNDKANSGKLCEITTIIGSTIVQGVSNSNVASLLFSAYIKQNSEKNDLLRSKMYIYSTHMKQKLKTFIENKTFE